MNDMTLKLIIVISLFTLQMFIAILLITSNRKKRPLQRLENAIKDEEKTLKKKAKKKTQSALDRRLQRAGVHLSSQQMLLRYMVIQVTAFLTGTLFLNIGMGLIAISLLHFYFFFWLKRKYKKRLKNFELQLIDAVQVISNAMKSGYSFFQALSRVVEDSQEPLSSAFSQLIKEISLGKAMEDAFEQLLESFPLEDLELMVSAILIQKEIGGNLSEILDTMLETLRERQRIQQEVQTLTAQGRFSGAIVVALPFGLGLILFLMNPSYMALLFTTVAGSIMVSIALVSQLFGILAIKKIITIKY
jgi:tight adherence protein B